MATTLYSLLGKSVGYIYWWTIIIIINCENQRLRSNRFSSSSQQEISQTICRQILEPQPRTVDRRCPPEVFRNFPNIQRVVSDQMGQPGSNNYVGMKPKNKSHLFFRLLFFQVEMMLSFWGIPSYCPCCKTAVEDSCKESNGEMCLRRRKRPSRWQDRNTTRINAETVINFKKLIWVKLYICKIVNIYIPRSATFSLSN